MCGKNFRPFDGMDRKIIMFEVRKKNSFLQNRVNKLQAPLVEYLCSIQKLGFLPFIRIWC